MFKHIDLVDGVVIAVVVVVTVAVATIWPIKCSHEPVFTFTNDSHFNHRKFPSSVHRRFWIYHRTNKLSMRNYSIFPNRNCIGISFSRAIHSFCVCMTSQINLLVWIQLISFLDDSVISDAYIWKCGLFVKIRDIASHIYWKLLTEKWKWFMMELWVGNKTHFSLWWWSQRP